MTRIQLVTTWSLTAALVNCIHPQGTSLSESASTQTAKQEGFRRIKLGAFKITIISDGTAVRDATELITISQWAAAAASPVRFLRYHAAVEAELRASGMATTFLRPNLFMQGLIGFRALIAAKGTLIAPVGDAKISVIDVRDIAVVAAAALIETSHAGKTYDLTGPEALSHGDLAAQLGAALGRPLRFVDVPPDAMRGALASAGFPAWQVDGLIEDYAHYARGAAAIITADVEKVTGRPARTFVQFARDYAGAFEQTS